jgi:quinone-modifying oxidoreductase subunit QmoA
MHQYYPKLDSPSVGLDMHLRRIKSNPNIFVLTRADALSISGTRGNFEVKIRVKPQYVNDNCTSCNKCSEVCPVEVDDHFNYSMKKTKAIHMNSSAGDSSPYIMERESCKETGCRKCVDVCADKAIDMDEQPREITAKAASVVLATGWEPYDAAKITNLGFGRVPNVINNVMMERLVAVNGPTGGKIIRPSDSREAKDIAFVQCAGSRDQAHLPYCSSICCLVSFKQANYVRKAYPDSKVTVVYTELTNPCPGRYDKFLSKVIDDERIRYVKGKVSFISRNEETGGVRLQVKPVRETNGVPDTEIMADMAVLATGMVPKILSNVLKEVMVLDQHGFMNPERQKEGIYIAGTAKTPFDVTSSMMDATSAAIRSSQGIRQ